MSRAPLAAAFALLVGLTAVPAVSAAPADAALRFGQALESGLEDDLRSALPNGGRIDLGLDALGAMDGEYGVRQVRAALSQFLSEGHVRNFRIVKERRSESAAWLTAHLVIHEPGGRIRNRALDLRYRLERNEWVLRTIRERDP